MTANPPCWCGVKNPYYAPLPSRCGGSGTLDCICGGDFCVCHNHGEVECPGCKDCEGDDDDYGHEPRGAATTEETMKPEAQRIALAEWAGIPVNVCKCGDSMESHTLGRNEHNFVPLAEESEVPNYLHDLNAVHELEKNLTGVQQNDYTNSLGFPANDVSHAAWKVCHATAAQRCEALLKTIGLWKP